LDSRVATKDAWKTRGDIDIWVVVKQIVLESWLLWEPGTVCHRYGDFGLERT
jgi:hypothetical protein